jgi:hypothetical protein
MEETRLAEMSPYFDAVTAQRSLLISDPSLFADATISLETQHDLARDTVGEAFREHFGRYVPFLRFLSPEDAELLLVYFVLGKPQWCIAKLYCSTQTICSFRIRLALKKLGLAATYGGPPPSQAFDDVLEAHNLNHLLEPVRTSLLVSEYETRRSFTLVADHLRLHRPDVRRALTKASTVLLSDQHDEHAAFGAWIHGMIDKASITGVGFTSRKAARHTHLHRVDPGIVGSFRINVSDVAFEDHVLVSRAAPC